MVQCYEKAFDGRPVITLVLMLLLALHFFSCKLNIKYAQGFNVAQIMFVSLLPLAIN